jgi:hypothetical protein
MDCLRRSNRLKPESEMAWISLKEIPIPFLYQEHTAEQIPEL